MVFLIIVEIVTQISCNKMLLILRYRINSKLVIIMIAKASSIKLLLTQLVCKTIIDMMPYKTRLHLCNLDFYVTILLLPRW